MLYFRVLSVVGWRIESKHMYPRQFSIVITETGFMPASQRSAGSNSTLKRTKVRQRTPNNSCCRLTRRAELQHCTIGSAKSVGRLQFERAMTVQGREDGAEQLAHQ